VSLPASMTIETSAGSAVMEAALALLQSGVGLPCRPGSSARDFLREALGLADDYIEGVVSTVFIDFEPVDDLDAARVVDGSLVALSAAMPGLVGAVMRRNSPYASFRKAISWETRHGAGEGGGGEGDRGTARLKLFNQVMRDLAEGIWARGLLLSVEEAGSLAALAGLPVPAGATHTGATIEVRIILKAGGP